MTLQADFSVVIPNYNNGATLARAIDSVLSQTFPAREIIVIDDGSTDDSERVAQKYADRIRYIRQPNHGVSVARNHGAEVATGDWLAFLDADDEYHPDRLRLHAEWIQEVPDLDFLLADQESRTPDGVLIEYFIHKSGFGRELLERHPGLERLTLAASDFGSLIADGFAEIRTLSVPRQRFLQLGGFPAGRKVGEDLHLFIRLFMHSQKVGVVPQSLATYYIYPESALRRDPVKAMESFVETIETLMSDMVGASPQIRSGFREKCRQGRLSLAYAYLRAGRHGPALMSVLPSLARVPSMQTLRDVISVGRGFKG